MTDSMPIVDPPIKAPGHEPAYDTFNVSWPAPNQTKSDIHVTIRLPRVGGKPQTEKAAAAAAANIADNLAKSIRSGRWRKRDETGPASSK